MINSVTKELIESKIKSKSFYVIPGTSVTVCNIVMANGFSKPGYSSSNGDKEKCRKEAYEAAFNPIWELEGYLLKEKMFRMEQQVERIAKACHEINRTYCESIGDMSQPKWEDAPDWQKDSARNGVLAHLEREVSPEESHNLWMREKLANGWVYGETKDEVMKTHPCIRPYEMLSKSQRAKDHIFKAVVANMKEI